MKTTKIAIKREQRQAVLGYAERAQFGAKLKLFFMAALALMTAACSNDDNDLTTPQPQKAEGITITAQLAPKTGGATTRAVEDKTTYIEAKWAEHEHIAILYTVGSTKKVADAEITAVDGSGTATITFTVDGGTPDNTACTLVYPLSAAKDDHTGVKDAATLLAAQDGTAQFAIFKFTLSGPSIDATHPLVIKDNASNTTITTVTPASTATSVFVAMPAAASKAYKFVVITADNKYIKSGTATIEAGKYYQTPLTMSPRYPLALSSATAEWDLGAVACSDGNLYMEKKAAPAGKTAVGILGKVTETGHGLILALQDAPSQTWNTINGWESVITSAGRTLKKLPDDEARGSLTDYMTLGSSLSDLIWVSNWCVAQKSDYEEIFVNLGSTTGNSSGTTFDANVNAYITTGVGGTAMSDWRFYWSATESNDSHAWGFLIDYCYEVSKTYSDPVRPVLAF